MAGRRVHAHVAMSASPYATLDLPFPVRGMYLPSSPRELQKALLTRREKPAPI